jgi:hypothetical protein
VAAAPYVVTLPFAAAFQYAEIGGPGQRFFEHWTKNHLRTELQNLRQMTDSYEFQEERPGGRLEAGDGWLRLLNVASRSLLAPLATAIVGWVAFFRSLYKAGRDTRAGKPAPRAVPYDDIGPMLGEWVKLSVRYGWMGGLAAGAVPPVVLAVGYAYGWPWAVSALTWALGLLGIDGLYKGSIESTGLYGTLAGAAVGLAAGLVVSVVFGVGAALVEWLAAQIEKDPPQAADRKDGSR